MQGCGMQRWGCSWSSDGSGGTWEWVSVTGWEAVRGHELAADFLKKNPFKQLGLCAPWLAYSSAGFCTLHHEQRLLLALCHPITESVFGEWRELPVIWRWAAASRQSRSYAAIPDNTSASGTALSALFPWLNFLSTTLMGALSEGWASLSS